jgi:hypothetical protein
MKKEIGKNTLGGGHKMAVDLKTYNRSTHDLSYIWRNTQSPGTLVPFMKSVALPGDIRDIDLEAKILTHPTVGPLYGSYKLQLDVFTCPIRLYISALHNNSLKVGMNMSKVKLPKLNMLVDSKWGKTYSEWGQVNPSSLLSYLGINGFGILQGDESKTTKMNAVPVIAYWDIWKNYYANKQEENGYYIASESQEKWTANKNVEKITYANNVSSKGQNEEKIIGTDEYIVNCFVPYTTSTSGQTRLELKLNFTEEFTAKYTKDGEFSWNDARYDKNVVKATNFANTGYEVNSLNEIMDIIRQRVQVDNSASNVSITYQQGLSGGKGFVYATFKTQAGSGEINTNYTDLAFNDFAQSKVEFLEKSETDSAVKIANFPMSNIDDMREDILQVAFYSEFNITSATPAPYGVLLQSTNEGPNVKNAQYGLALKTYQSDIFNNWINTEWIDGENGINELTAVSTEGGSFTIDALNIAQKVYNMLNRIALSDGTYRSWLETVWTNEYVSRCESPVYEGGLSQEIVFDEVVSTAGSTAQGDEPLGSLAGRGGLMKNRKGGSIRIKIDEPCYIIGIVSITPRLDYSQGNDFDIDLDNMDDWHKPELDAIGFQDLPASWAAWSERKIGTDGEVTQRSFGKQPAWIEYMTNFNRTKGNFAINNSEAFMVLNRNYTINESGEIQDATTYIDPVKYNYVFADTNLDAMNFWVQIGVNDIARRKMSAKIIPNL